MKKFRVKMIDSLSIVPFEVPEANKQFLHDSIYSANNSPLMVKIAATHAGLVTRNNGFYMPDKMRDAAITFIESYGKPILLHHNSYSGEPVGRIKNAQYIDTSRGLYKNDSTKDYFKDFVDPSVSFSTKVELVDKLIKDDVLNDPAYEGVGYIEVIGAITDKEAAQKVLDNRYLTVSIGAETDAAICSVCKTDWAESGEMCDHVPGEIYDDKTAFLIAGNLWYDELSFVNTPADPHAKVVQVTTGDIMDSKAITGKEREGQKSEASFDIFLKKGDTKFDLFKEGVIKDFFHTYKDNKKEDKKPMKKLIEDASKLSDSEHIAGVIAARVDAIVAADDKLNKDFIVFAASSHFSTIAEDQLAEVTEEDFDAAVIELHNFIQNVVDADEEGFSKIKEDEKDSRLGLVEDIAGKFRKPAQKPEGNDEPLGDLLALDSVAVAKEIESIMDEAGNGDSKVDTKKVKALPKTSFCIANKKGAAGFKGYFPVPNIDYVDATREYLDHEDCILSAETKAEVTKVLDRKSKVLGGKKESPKSGEVEFKVEGLSDEKLKDIGKQVFDALKEKDLLDECAGCDESAIVIQALEDKVIGHEDHLKVLRLELQEAYKDSEDVNEMYEELMDSHKALVTKNISDIAILKGEELDEGKIKEFEKKSISSLTDELNTIKDGVDFLSIGKKVNDGMGGDPDGGVADPTLQHEDKDKFSKSVFNKVMDNYYTLLLSKGKVVADNYLTGCKSKGLVPADLKSLEN